MPGCYVGVGKIRAEDGEKGSREGAVSLNGGNLCLGGNVVFLCYLTREVGLCASGGKGILGIRCLRR